MKLVDDHISHGGGVTHLAGPSLGQIADDDNFLGCCERSDHLTNLEDKFFSETRFIVGIVSKFTATFNKICMSRKDASCAY